MGGTQLLGSKSLDFKCSNENFFELTTPNADDDFMLAHSNFSSQQEKSRKEESYCIQGSRFFQSTGQFSQSAKCKKNEIIFFMLYEPL